MASLVLLKVVCTLKQALCTNCDVWFNLLMHIALYQEEEEYVQFKTKCKVRVRANRDGE